MITTWGVFWISLFSSIVLSRLIVRLIPKKMSDADFERVKQLTEIFSKNLEVKIQKKK